MRKIGSRLGLSTVITSFMLLTITAVLGIVVVGWGNNTFAANSRNLATVFNNNINQVNENPIIEKIYFVTSPTKFTNITLSNQGSESFNVTSVKFTAPGQPTTTILFKKSIVMPGKVFWVKINSTVGAGLGTPYNFADGVVDTIQISTARGTSISTMAITP